MTDELATLHAALSRERASRKAAEALLEQKSRELYQANTDLKAFAERLENLVLERTSELAVARDEAVNANRAKSQFLANVSHELRTPLNAIIGYSEMLLEDAEGSGQSTLTSDLNRIHHAGKHLLTLINEILDLSKIEAGQSDLYLESVGLADLIADVAATLRPLLEKNANSLQLDLAPTLGIARTDATKLRQSLLNLVSNAAKFTTGGQIRIAAERRFDAGREWIQVRVSDTGIGITPEHMDDLFTPFKQGDASTTRRFGGTGLGLAISASFCQMLGGGITVESVLGQGSTFTMSILAECERGEGAESAQETTAVGALGTVLVIDDDPLARDMLRRHLSATGFGVITARDGAEGLRLAHTPGLVAITLDVIMPRVDGWSVLSALQADPALRDVPVVIVSVMADHEVGLSLGASNMLGKPVDRERLTTLLKRFAHHPKSILVVEDDLEFGDLVGNLLTDHGCHVSRAYDGLEALEWLGSNHPDLIVLDIMMPGMDGFTLLERLRECEAWHAIPVVVATAKELTAEDRARLSGQTQQILQKGKAGPKGVLQWLQRLVTPPEGQG